MNNEKFVFKIKRYSIPEPQDFSIRKISCLDFFNSTSAFIENNFAGAIKIDFPESYKGFIHISPRGFAYFIFLLLSEIYGKSMVNVKIAASDSEITLKIDSQIKIEHKSQLIDTAVRSGFSVTEEENSLTLKTSLKLTQETFVYATDNLELINYYYEVFLSQK